MNNYIKVPLPKYKSEIIELFNSVLSSHKDWDGVTKIIDITVNEKTLNLTLTKADGALSYKEDSDLVYKIISGLGFVYEYNL
ncbi:hypothetical protein KZN62_003589 [Vibrio cholerae]|nr:hypothetical protein [Vibrio cholerae]EHV9954636.1 hypothetical protein [Vibrio cholerae]